MSSTVYNTIQARQTIWWIDVEIALALISNALACVFVGLQHFHVKSHPEMLPFISIFMLLILTLGHMMPLAIDFEKLFLQRDDRQNQLLGRSESLEVNEVIIRLLKMIAFSLQFRLLQLTWSARSSDEKRKSLWFAEKTSVLVSIPFYASGTFAVLLTNWTMREFGLKSFAGVVLGGFLLPQVLLNVFWDSKENMLSHSFYMGNTFLQLLPHACNLYKAYNFISESSFVNVSPPPLDVIMPLWSLLFAAIIYLQQRFGGNFIPVVGS